MSNNKTTTAAADKIAIVGVACRFPGGVASLADYWKVLSEGQDVVSEISEERFGARFYQHPNRKEPGKSVTFAAGVLEDVEHFDADFFGISPREAEQLDPQQRLLLELSWEALENGGQVPEQLAGSDCAVYVGIASTDYLNRRVDDPASMDAYTMTGNTASIASNRISYVYDLHGPSVSVDTACSSSLVAVHHACQAIRTGEAGMALVGGVNMLLHPFAFVGFSQASMLSAHGRCRTFDAAGDGYVRAEGAAMLFLKPLAQAEADGDPIQGVIVASGVNSDGRTNGLTVPSNTRQGELLRRVYAQAEVSVDDLVYLEAHGTGTAVGDPIETRAIGEVLGQARRADKPLLIGSAKSNLGHLETASGMAGLLKSLLVLQRQQLPPSLHIETLNPKIGFAEHNLEVVTRLTPISAEPGQRQLVGVNSFGFGGANAHALIERYMRPEQPSASSVVNTRQSEACRLPPLFLSARNKAALQALAGHYAQWLTGEDQTYYHIAWSAARHRQHLSHGLVVHADSLALIKTSLEKYAQGESGLKTVVTGEVQETDAQLALVFSGNGCQWQGMGQVLLETDAVFRAAVQEVDQYFRGYADYSLLDEMAKPEQASRLHLTEVAQPLLFAFQVGVVAVLRHQGVCFTAVVGHSVGEVAAAWAAGALSLKQAVQVIYARSHAQSQTAGQGRMAAVGLGVAAIRHKLAELGLQDQVEVAGMNSPQAVTLSGELADLTGIGEVLQAEGIFFRLLDLNYAFHSHRMDPIQAQLIDALADLQPVSTDAGIAFYSTVEGQAIEGAALNARYWWENIRQPVNFAGAMQQLISTGNAVFLEVGPHAILRSYVNECLREQHREGRILSTGKRKQERPEILRKAALQLWLAGCEPDWAVHFPKPGQFVPLPNYPWQRERYWYPLTTDGYDLVNRRREHPLLGYRLRDAEALWENQLDTATLPYLADHVVDGAVIVPGAAYIEMALAASAAWYKGASHALEYFEIHAPIMLEEGRARSVRFTLNTSDGSFTITSRERLSDDAWTLNVVGRLTGPVLKEPAAVVVPEVKALMTRAEETISHEGHYRLTRTVGLTYLSAFQAVRRVWATGTGQALAELALPEVVAPDAAAYWLHPSLLDGAFQTLVDVFREAIHAGQLAALIPIQIGQLNYFAVEPAQTVHYVQVEVTKQNPRSVVADFLLLGEQGDLLAELTGCRFRGVQFIRHQDKEPDVYEFVPCLQPLAATAVTATLPDWPALSHAAVEALEQREPELCRARHYQQIAPLLEVLATRYAWDAFYQLSAGQLFSVTNWLQQGVVKPEQRALLHYLLQQLSAQQLVHSLGEGQWQLAETCDLPEAQAIWLSILGDSPAHLPELVMLGRCGAHLADVLRGAVSAETLLTPPKSSIQAHWQDTAPSFRAANIMLEHWVQAAVQALPEHAHIRVLELGAGTGALTHRLLPLLPAGRCDYVFAEAQQEWVEQAQAAFEDYGFFQAIQLPPGLEGEAYEALQAQAAFDWIIVGNALYDWGEVPATLSRLRGLLKQQGTLLQINARDSQFLNLTCGLQESWWVTLEGTGDAAAGETDEEAETAHWPRLLQEDEWQAALATAGFGSLTPLYEPVDVHHAGAYLAVTRAAEGLVAGAETEPEMPSSSLPKHSVVVQNWLLLCDESGFSFSLASALQQRLVSLGHMAILSHDPLIQDEAGHKTDHIVHLQGLAFEQAEDLVALQERRCVGVTHCVQALEQRGLAAKLWLVTAGAMPDGAAGAATPLLPEQAPLWGLGRVLMNEHPELQCTLVDLQHKVTPQQAAEQVLPELLYADGEDEILLGADGRRVMRLQKTSLQQTRQTQPEHIPVGLDFTAPGPLKNLYWRALPEQALQADEVEIQPHATGLNFRDVMYAMGLLSDEAVENGFAGASLGMELAGTVMRVGEAVEDFRVGDAVIGFAPACFSTRVISRTTAFAHKPASWTDEEAATVPTTFFTVYYALQHLAHLEEGERILIHGASGGVGLAAIQFARYKGAEVFATAGTDEKREFVRLMGADHVLDSRSLKFAEDIRQLTNGEGVDIILNSISGEAINKNLSILRPFGRLLELGKRDFYENSKIGLRPFRNNISYFGIDADQLLIERPRLAGRLFREMMALFEAGVLRPLPHRVFSARRIQEAFRYMQQSRQIGKVIVSFSGQSLQPTYPTVLETPPLRLDAQASYLVTGGLSGFGLRTAQWLVEKGARHLVLLGRSGAKTEQAQQGVRELQGQGVQVMVQACDVADKAALHNVLTQVAAQMPPLKGVVHAAMVLADALVRNLQAERFQAVLAPKMLGAWNLHELTREIPLDFFVLYSSVTTYLGNPGQGNYVAANMYLESLAAWRRARGLPAVFAAWGALDDVGFLARETEIREALQSRLGGQPLSSDQALLMLERLMASDKTGAAVIDMDWSVVQRFMPAARAPKYIEQQRQAKGGDEGEQGEDIASLIAGLSLPEVEALVADLLMAEVGEILRLPRDKLAVDKSVFDLGMDSLMGMELVLAIEERFGVKLPVMALTEGATISRIAEKIAAQLMTDEHTATDAHLQTVTSVVGKHGTEMSPEQLEALAKNLSGETTDYELKLE